MDAKKVAMVVGITILLPLFLGLFVDAVYTEPKYENYCKYNSYSSKAMPVAPTNCSYNYGPEYDKCINDKGEPRLKPDSLGCDIFDKCDFCNLEFQKDQSLYNRNIFFILLPVGLVIVILGIYLVVDYIGAALMFAGLITMFYATIRYFSDMSKILRALIILAELLIIMWIGYKKIEDKKASNSEAKNSNKKGKSRKKK